MWGYARWYAQEICLGQKEHMGVMALEMGFEGWMGQQRQSRMTTGRVEDPKAAHSLPM